MDAAERWAERVDDALSVELGLLARRALAPCSSSSPLTGGGGIAALEGIGLLGPESAAGWRERFAVADHPFAPVELDDALRERLYGHLAGLARTAPQRLPEVLHAFRQVGLIDSDEEAW
ncbi:MAG: hypothetical protein ABI317_08660, partial [Gaiellales bacterium]